MKKALKKVLLLFIISTISSPSHGMEGVQVLYEKIRNNFCFALGVTQKGKQFAINHPFVTAGTICLGATTTAYLAYKWFFNKPKNTPSTIIQTNSHPEQTTTNLNKLPKTSPEENNAVIKINNNLNQFKAIEIDSITNKTEIINLHELTRNINGEFNVFRITNKSASILQNLYPNYFPKNQEGLHTVMNATTKEIFFASQKTDQGYICLVNENINKNGNALGWETGDVINPPALPMPKNTPQVTVILSLKTDSENSMQQLFRKIIDATTNILFTPKKNDQKYIYTVNKNINKNGNALEWKKDYAINPSALPMPENSHQVTITSSPEINTEKLLTPDQKNICPINENINKNSNALELKKNNAINPLALPMPEKTPQVTIAPSPQTNTKNLMPQKVHIVIETIKNIFFTPEKNYQGYINKNINQNIALELKKDYAINPPALPMSNNTSQATFTPPPQTNTKKLIQQCKLPYNGTIELNRITTITLEQLKSILSNNAMGSEKPKHKKEKKKTKSKLKITSDTDSNQEQESTKNLDQAQIIDDLKDSSVTSTITPDTISTEQQNNTDNTDDATETININDVSTEEQLDAPITKVLTADSTNQESEKPVIQDSTPEQQSTTNLNQVPTKKPLNPTKDVPITTSKRISPAFFWQSTDTDRRHEKEKQALKDAQTQSDIQIRAENFTTNTTNFELGMW